MDSIAATQVQAHRWRKLYLGTGARKITSIIYVLRFGISLYSEESSITSLKM